MTQRQATAAATAAAASAAAAAAAVHRVCYNQLPLFVWPCQVLQFRVVPSYRRHMGYFRVDCRAGAFALLDTLPCSLPCGTDNQDYENHLYVDCLGVGRVARGLRTL